ncbi:hypothetical protein ONS95_005315 [Cadophora gregata]|uniref:uncharacterized protein n=1 Tax=Cadophora gregata TaxID=51156 RepID=UPI0026DD04D5|nr:uncharacterized protein ONS95_005315 [Cadophora gregata]KAK0103280.1 hypothetical protein ONS95_005315 [Cadophora gregata]KAK0107474.1 hypothetical protein ONS96_003289 [Cadophora gregata f. sp. sojae]
MSILNTPKKQWMKGSSTKTVPLKGYFADGIWHCNCNPRLPAANFQVKKEGPNTGRWFYTCQQPKESGCGFFLWKDDAVGREMTAVIANSRSEPGAAGASKTTGPRPGAGDKSTEDDNDEFGDWSLSPEEERKLEQSITRAESGSPSPETPRKATKTTQFSTPNSKRKFDESVLPTPSTGGRTLTGFDSGRRDEDVFTTPATISKGTWDGRQAFGLRSPSGTPTPARYRESTVASDVHSQPSQNGYDITDEVLELLKDQHIDDETTTSLKQLLSKHAMKISGIAKGRDITRVALKAKETKIAELQQKISALEAQRELDRTVIRHFKSDMTESVERRRGRGRGRGG